MDKSTKRPDIIDAILTAEAYINQPRPNGENEVLENTSPVCIDLGDIKTDDICPVCGGRGKQKAMRAAMTFDGPSVRVEDFEWDCFYCSGTGKVRKRT